MRKNSLESFAGSFMLSGGRHRLANGMQRRVADIVFARPRDLSSDDRRQQDIRVAKTWNQLNPWQDDMDFD